MRHQPLVALASGALVSALVAGASALVGTGLRGSGAPERRPAASPPAQQPMSAARPEPEPVIGSNFPDPEVLKADGTYYGYATNDNGRNVPVATAPSPGGPWTRTGGDALPGLPVWAEPGRTWAPDVSVRADGAYLMYFTAGQKGTAEQCVGAAVARTPAGPFTPEPAPLACRDGKDTIDPAAFTDTGGVRYVLYKQEGDGRKAPGGIFLQRTTPDGLRPQGARTLILDKGAGEPDLVEAPALVKRDGRYVLFYAAGVFWEERYQTRYATAASITGPYSRAPRPLLTTGGYDRKIVGPGGADVVHDGTDAHLVFHGITRFMGGRTVLRSMYVARLGWAGTTPVVRGSPVRHEAEDGRVYGGRLLRDVRGASGGAAAGYLDNAQSLVDFDVYAPVAGAYLLKVRYGNRTDGGRSPAEHLLTVNGAGRTPVRYPAGAPGGGWRGATTEVGLRAGWNVVRLAHGSGFAEIDYIEVS